MTQRRSRGSILISGVCVILLAGCRPPPGQDSADLSLVARAMELVVPEGDLWTARDIPSLGGPPMSGTFEAPQTVRMWLRSEGSSDSCSGTVVEVELEEYIRHVIPHEWYASWHEESLRAGAVAARSYAAWWVTAGGKYDCADVCDTSYTQNYGESTDSRTDAAIEDTRGTFIMDEGGVVFAEYSAENGDPTAYGVSEPHCAGEDLYGHGRGMCQWGSQRWASIDGKDHEWMADHYYLGATLLPPLVAERLDDEDILYLESGEKVTLELVWENQGSTRWTDGDIHLDSVDPVGRTSEFAAGRWPSDSRAVTLEEDVSPGQMATLDVTLLAPEVDEHQTFTESFGLYVESADDWISAGGFVDLEIQVYPLGDAPQVDTGTDDGVDTGTGDGERSPAALPERKTTESESGCSCGGGAGGISWGLALVLLGLLGRRRSV